MYAFRKLAHMVGMVLYIALSAMPLQARAESVGIAIVQSFYDTLLTTMHDGQALGSRGRYGLIKPVIERIFDIPLMTRLTLGPHWDTADEAERQQVILAFEHYLVSNFAGRFDSYSGERLEITGERPASNEGNMFITSRITKSTGEQVNIDYLLHNYGGHWKIIDVYYNGTISEVATRRSDYSKVLRDQGIGGLISMIKAKADKLLGAPAS